jgi:hypothetical protein
MIGTLQTRPPDIPAMTLDDDIKGMTNEELRKLVPNCASFFNLSTMGMGASMELERREKDRLKPIKREQAIAKHEEFLRLIEEEGFHPPTVEAVSALMARATHVAFTSREPETFQAFEGWDDPDTGEFLLKIGSPYQEHMIASCVGMREDIVDLGCIRTRQIMQGMIRGHRVVICGKHYGESDLFVDVMSFLTRIVTFVPATSENESYNPFSPALRTPL